MISNTNSNGQDEVLDKACWWLWKWKWGTLKTLTKRAYDICSNQELLQKELNYIEKVFRANNNYPNWVIKKVLQQAKQQQQEQ